MKREPRGAPERTRDWDAVHLEEGLQDAALREAALHRDDHHRIRRASLHREGLEIHKPAAHECVLPFGFMVLGSTSANVALWGLICAQPMQGHSYLHSVVTVLLARPTGRRDALHACLPF